MGNNLRSLPAIGKLIRLPQLATLVEIISKRILGQPASLTYGDSDGRTVYEWHRDGGVERWSEIQGKPIYVHPRRLNKSGGKKIVVGD